MTTEPDDLEALRQRVAQLEGGRRGRVGWGKVVLCIAGAVIVLLVIAQAFGPKTYGDIAKQEAADCVRTGNDGRWFPGDGNLQDICQIRGDVKALQRQAIDGAQSK